MQSFLAGNGTGTSASPFRLENKTITALPMFPAIRITDTTLFLVIQNCTLSGINSILIQLSNCSNVNITQNYLSQALTGIGVQSGINISISDNDFFAVYYGASLNASNNTSFCDNDVMSQNMALFGEKSANITARNNSIVSYSSGCYFQTSVNVSLRNNTISGAPSNGISFASCSNCSLVNNTISDTTSEGVYAANVRDMVIQYNSISNGISLNSGNSTKVENNSIAGSITHGIIVSYCFQTEFKNNTMQDAFFTVTGEDMTYFTTTIDASNRINNKPVFYYTNRTNLISTNFTGAAQVFVVNCNNTQVTDVDLSGTEGGLVFYLARSTSFENMTMNSYSSTGIYIVSSTGTTMIGCSIGYCQRALELFKSNNTLIDRLSLHDCPTGLRFDSTRNITIENCRIMNSTQIGIEFQGICPDTVIKGNTVDQAMSGIAFNGMARNCTFQDNDLTNITQNGISLLGQDVQVGNNTFRAVGTGLYALGWNFTIFNNTCHFSKTGFRLENMIGAAVRNNSIRDNSESGVIVVTSSEIVIEGNRIENNTGNGLEIAGFDMEIRQNVVRLNGKHGIQLVLSASATPSWIVNNTVSSNDWDGVYFQGNDTTIENNTIQSNSRHGIELSSAWLCKITNNTCTRNTRAGIFLNGSVSLVNQNTIELNEQEGIVLQYAYLNNITGNRISYNAFHGIKLIGASYNRIYLNRIGGNYQPQVLFDPAHPSGINLWFQGTLGNYWGDYEARYPDAVPMPGYYWSIPYQVGEGAFTPPGFAPMDYYPLVDNILDHLVVLSSPADVIYTYEQDGNEITWYVVDNIGGIKTYVIYRNGSSVAQSAWSTGTAISIDVDGLPVGSYNYTIAMSDEFGRTVFDTVIVTVTKGTSQGLPISWTTADSLLVALIVIMSGFFAFVVLQALSQSRRFRKGTRSRDLPG
ncbi:MAG: right-handed parallel beta-helix repeat-containing protein [Candidatus Lokiarchaeota archaeon]|nr:right-handed parallel beta-helix repeat-containing protein [Candidatus Lokiarchaeota archaeon]